MVVPMVGANVVDDDFEGDPCDSTTADTISATRLAIKSTHNIRIQVVISLSLTSTVGKNPQAIADMANDDLNLD